jgi:hypothetical protein
MLRNGTAGIDLHFGLNLLLQHEADSGVVVF